MTQNTYEKFVLSRLQEARALLNMAYAEMKRDGASNLDHPLNVTMCRLQETGYALDVEMVGWLAAKDTLPIEGETGATPPVATEVKQVPQG